MREDGLLWAELGEAAPVMVSGWHLLKLTPRDARELQGELRALHERYARRSGEVPFLMGIFLADTSDVPGSNTRATPTVTPERSGQLRFNNNDARWTSTCQIAQRSGGQVKNLPTAQFNACLVTPLTRSQAPAITSAIPGAGLLGRALIESRDGERLLT